jgi:hypothetical protein
MDMELMLPPGLVITGTFASAITNGSLNDQNIYFELNHFDLHLVRFSYSYLEGSLLKHFDA